MTSLCSLCFIMTTCSERLASAQSFFHGLRGDSCFVIVIQVFSGLAIAQMLKHTSVITKCYTMALGISFEVFLAHRFSAESTSMPMAFSAFLIAMSTLLYSTANIPESPDKQQRNEACSSVAMPSAKFHQTQFNWQIAGCKSPSTLSRVI